MIHTTSSSGISYVVSHVWLPPANTTSIAEDMAMQIHLLNTTLKMWYIHGGDPLGPIPQHAMHRGLVVRGIDGAYRYNLWCIPYHVSYYVPASHTMRANPWIPPRMWASQDLDPWILGGTPFGTPRWP